MSSRFAETVESLAGPLYFISMLLVATPVLDFAGSVLPLRPDNIEWRFATVGLLSGFLLTPVLGFVLALAVAAASSHGVAVRALCVLAMGIGLASSALLIAFLLDIVQLRSAVTAEAKAAFEGAATKAVLKHLTFIMAMTWLGVRGYRAHRAEPRRFPSPHSFVIGG